MKINSIITSAAVLGAAIAIPARADSGRPSEVQAGIATACAVPAAPIDAGQDAQVGSYARYLMLNGKPRDRAIAEARNIDHRTTLDIAPQRVAPSQTASAPADRQPNSSSVTP